MIKRGGELRTEVRERMRDGNGTVTVRHYFDREDFGAKIRLCAQLVLPPGASIGTHRHEAEDEIYLITRGRGILEEGNAKTPVSAGDAVLTGKGEAHSILNDGTEPLEISTIIVCYA